MVRRLGYDLLRAPETAPGATENSLPFPRRATAALARAVSGARRAAATAVASGDLSPFTEAVGEGVSANLCESLASLLDQSETVRLRFSWARGRPAPVLPSEEVFARGTADVLWEVSRKYRQEAPRPRFELEGYVVELQIRAKTRPRAALPC